MNHHSKEITNTKILEVRKSGFGQGVSTVLKLRFDIKTELLGPFFAWLDDGSGYDVDLKK